MSPTFTLLRPLSGIHSLLIDSHSFFFASDTPPKDGRITQLLFSELFTFFQNAVHPKLIGYSGVVPATEVLLTSQVSASIY